MSYVTDLIARAREIMEFSEDSQVIGELAHELEKAQPRIIETYEELDALPEGSVVLDRDGLSLHKQNTLGIWNASNCTWDVQREEIEGDAFPATVLHEPKEETK